MIFVDMYCEPATFHAVHAAIQDEVGRVLGVRPADVVVRRFAVESTHPGVELWVELSDDEQLYRHGTELAQAITRVVQAVQRTDVWVMYRIVPLQRAFLNGEPRARGSSVLG